MVIVLPSLTYGSEVWKWNDSEQAKIRTVEMSYLRATCGLTVMERTSGEEIYRKSGRAEKEQGVNFGVAE